MLLSDFYGIRTDKTFSKFPRCSLSFPVLSRSPWNWQGSLRTLYSGEWLELDAYEKSRNRARTQFREDLKNIVHLAEDEPADLALVLQMLKKFSQENKQFRFGNFVVGPVVMRMYHFLNKPTQAVATFRDEELNDVLSVFEVAKAKPVQGIKYPLSITVLALASCWKLNSLESYKYALQVLNDLTEIGSKTTLRGVTFVAALALQQNAPSVALEILSLVRSSNYFTVKNLKIAALADLDRPEDAFHLLRHAVETSEDPVSEKRSTICKDVLEKLAAAVGRLRNKEISLEFERIQKAMSEVQLISNDTIQVFLDTEIEYTPNKPGLNKQPFQRDTLVIRGYMGVVDLHGHIQ
ncbi:unnamed protein product [Allacma fusca]|uniref:Uncharacterized protein n=1 Tax=Allacma fusca TaxID=39272 RepID=A0A8J2K036_9HEXA|nr:unnamed protein product [Allacma fusca]